MTCSGQRVAIRHWALIAGLVIFLATASALQAQTLTVLHSFTDGADGGNPGAGLTMDRAGNLYGTASGIYANIGSAFELKSVGASWVLNSLFDFSISNEGTYGYGPTKLVFGPDGALYGSATEGGEGTCDGLGCGTIFKLQPRSGFCPTFHCDWNITVLFYFSGNSGGFPDQIVFGSDGNIYGTTFAGGNLGGSCGQNGCGTVHLLTDSGGGVEQEHSV